MTGAGAPGAPGIIKCLQQAEWINLTVADADANATGKFLCTDFFSIPLASDPSFIDRLKQVCHEKNIQIILPLVTSELDLLALHKEFFKDSGIQILVSSASALKIANNKSLCYQVLKEKGIEIPDFHVVSRAEQFIHAAFSLGHPQKAFCFKPSVSNGSRGVRIVSDSIDESDQLFHQKPYNLFITYAHALKILTSKAFPELLVTEYLPGTEYSVDCLANNGEAIIVVPRSRLKMVNGISVQGKIEKHEKIMDYCTHIIKALGLHGNIGIQVKLNEAEEPRLLEINPRVQGTIVAGLGAGINLPLLAVKQELQMKISPEETDVKWDTCFSRYWTEVYY